MAPVRGWLKALCLGSWMLMAGCGGGGANHTTVNVVYKKWQGTVLTDMALPLVPGGGHALSAMRPKSTG